MRFSQVILVDAADFAVVVDAAAEAEETVGGVAGGAEAIAGLEATAGLEAEDGVRFFFSLQLFDRHNSHSHIQVEVCAAGV